MTMSGASMRHDGLFKTFLTHPATARDFLTCHLPPRLLAVCNLDTLQLESASFLEEDLRPYFADVLYSLKTRQGDGYVYTLIEHQSSPDKHMAFRLMRYAIAAMQRHLDAGYTHLPLVIPLLFCHGRASPWSSPMNWLDLFSEPDIARQLYSNAFPLIDVSAMEDDEIMQHRAMAMLELLFKHIRRRDLAELLDPLVTLMSAGYTTEQQLTALITWMLQTGDSAQPQALLASLACRLPHEEEMLMTIAQKLIQEGKLEGITEGKLEGIKEGKLEGIREGIRKGELDTRSDIARAMLREGADPAFIMKTTGLTAQELAKLRH